MNKLFFLPVLLVGMAAAQEPVVRTPGSPSFTSGTYTTPPAPVIPTGRAVIASSGIPEERSIHAEFQDDPAHALYKEGYSLVLSKKWKEAREKFARLLNKYPKSKYADAAEYWTAYSYTRTDEEKAREMYQRFLSRYPESEYLDDAVADYEKLQAKSELLLAVPIPPSPPNDIGETYIHAAEEQLLEAELFMSEYDHAVEYVVVPRVAEPLDESTRLRIDAIRALARSTDDPEAFVTVRDIALDTSQALQVRVAAIQEIHRFKTHDVTSVYLTLASSGKEELRVQAIYGLGRTNEKNHERVAKALSGYCLDQAQPQRVREASLVSLMRLNSPGTYETLVSLAKNDPHLEMRRQALYMIGRTGEKNEQRSLAFLREIIMDRQQPAKVRETAIYALTLSKGDESVSLLRDIARSDPEPMYRVSALYALVRRQREYPKEVTGLLMEIARNEAEEDEIRIAALRGLGATKNEDLTAMCKSMALRDKSQRVRVSALRLLAEHEADKTVLVSSMIEVFQAASPEDREVHDAALYGIAHVGNDQAITFLSTVARTHKEYDTRRRAIYYLGSVGGENARKALMEILKKK